MKWNFFKKELIDLFSEFRGYAFTRFAQTSYAPLSIKSKNLDFEPKIVFFQTLEILIFDPFTSENLNKLSFLPLKIVNFGAKIQIDYFPSFFLQLEFLTIKWSFGTLWTGLFFFLFQFRLFVSSFCRLPEGVKSCVDNTNEFFSCRLTTVPTSHHEVRQKVTFSHSCLGSFSQFWTSIGWKMGGKW